MTSRTRIVAAALSLLAASCVEEDPRYKGNATDSAASTPTDTATSPDGASTSPDGSSTSPGSTTDPGDSTSGSGEETGSGSTSGPGTSTDSSSTAGSTGSTTGSSTGGSTGSTTGPGVCNAAQLWDFETCPQSWTVEKAHPDSAEPTWACGEPTTGPDSTEHPGQWATGLDGNYASMESNALVSPPIDLTSCEGTNVRLLFEHWWEFEGGVQNYDGALMQLSIDGGANWSIVDPEVNGYFLGRTIQAWWAPVHGEYGWCSQKDAVDQTWFVSELDLGPYVGNPDVRVRFVIGTDDTATRPGWYIDWVEVTQQ